MEERDAASDVTNVTGAGARAASKPSSVTGRVETQTQKRVIQLTAKALGVKIDKLQTVRKAKLNKADNIRKSMQGLILKGNKINVQSALDELMEVCDEAKGFHESLLGLLPHEEKEKHATWFKAKMLSNDECIADAKLWVSYNEGNAHETENDNVLDDINPNDSVSNVGSKRSSQRSGKSSTTSSARIKAEADRAALVARFAALKGET